MQKIVSFLKKNYLLVTLCLLVVFLIALFFSIFEDVWTNDPNILRFDGTLLNYVIGHRNDFFNNYFKFITNFGDIPIVLVISILISIILILKKRYHHLLALVIEILGDGLFIFTIKDIVQRSRPSIQNALINESGFSFPSGHSFIAICFYGFITYLIFKNLRNIYLKILLILISIIFILSIAFSRIYLGVHWTSDVIASICASIIFLILVIYMLEKQLILNNKD